MLVPSTPAAPPTLVITDKQVQRIVLTDCAKRVKVYVAGPYSKGDVAGNVKRAILTADILLREGFAPYLPHLTHFWHLLYAHPVADWLNLDNEYLAVCDVVLRMAGESAGADAEVELAKQLGKPVYFRLVGLLKAYGVKL